MNEKDIRVEYQIEIINDAKTWDKFIKATESLNAPYGDAPWELYTCKEFDDFAEAMQYYMVWYVSEDCYDIKMWQRIYIKDEVIYEEYLEPASTTRSEMRRMIDKGTYERLSNYQREVDELEMQNKLMNNFIKYIDRQDMFNNFMMRKRYDEIAAKSI